MSIAHPFRPTLEPLDQRIVPAVLDLTTAGSTATAPSGAILQQNSTLTPEALDAFVRMQSSSLLGGLLGGLLGTGTEQGYNSNARPVQFDESAETPLNHAIALGDVPQVTVNGTAYREFLLTINQSNSSPYLSLDELRVYLDPSGNLSGYNASAKTLGGQTAAFNLDAGGDVSVRLNDNLAAASSTPDLVLLIPDSAFAGASADTFVHLFSKFGVQLGSAANDGFEQWSLRELSPLPPPPPPPPPPPTPASLSGFLFADEDRDGVWDETESGLSGVSVTLQGFDDFGEVVALEVQTAADGSFIFSDLLPGTYTLEEHPQFGYGSGMTTAGSEGGDAEPGRVSNITIEEGDAATGYIFADVYEE